MTDKVRYLTEGEKKELLADWNRAKEGKQGSLADKDIIPLCDALNELRGVCTIQSCSGHPNIANLDGSHYVQKAHLWLRLDEENSKKFYEQAFKLADNKLIEVVEILFHPKDEWGGEIVSIIFEGNNSGKLSATSKTIISFFSELIIYGGK